MTVSLKLVFSLILSSSLLLAQGEATILSLLIPPAHNGMGRGGVALTNVSAETAYFNPAHLSKNAENMVLAVDLHPGAQEWVLNLSYQGQAIASGFYSEQGKLGFNRLAFGLRQYRLLSDENFQLFQLTEKATAASLGLGFTRFVDMDFGFALKRVSSEFPKGVTGDLVNGSATTYDFGLLLTIPVLSSQRAALFGSPASQPTGNHQSVNITFGYALQNWPGKIIFSDDPEEEFLLPHTGRLGYAIEWKMLSIDQNTIVEAAFLSEAENLLIEGDGNGGLEATVPFGEINPIKNVLGFQSSNRVANHWGVRIGALDLIRFSYGGYEGNGFFDQSTTELDLMSVGLFHLLFPDMERNSLLKRINLSYRYSSFLELGGDDYKLGFHGVSLTLLRK